MLYFTLPLKVNASRGVKIQVAVSLVFYSIFPVVKLTSWVSTLPPTRPNANPFLITYTNFVSLQVAPLSAVTLTAMSVKRISLAAIFPSAAPFPTSKIVSASLTSGVSSTLTHVNLPGSVLTFLWLVAWTAFMCLLTSYSLFLLRLFVRVVFLITISLNL